MPLTNAEKQAAWRQRREARLHTLEQQVSDLKRRLAERSAAAPEQGLRNPAAKEDIQAAQPAGERMSEAELDTERQRIRETYGEPPRREPIPTDPDFPDLVEEDWYDLMDAIEAIAERYNITAPIPIDADRNQLALWGDAADRAGYIAHRLAHALDRLIGWDEVAEEDAELNDTDPPVIAATFDLAADEDALVVLRAEPERPPDYLEELRTWAQSMSVGRLNKLVLSIAPRAGPKLRQFLAGERPRSPSLYEALRQVRAELDEASVT